MPRWTTGATALFLLSFLGLAGCSRTTVVLWTDRPEVAPVVEQFNAEQDEHVVELQYEQDASRSLRLTDSVPDVVIAGSLEDQSTAALFRSLDRLLKHDVVPEAFYQPLLASGYRSNNQLLLPVSFNLPLVYFAKGAVELDDGITLSPDQMREAGVSFTEIAEDGAERISFSPLWDGEFLYELIRLQGFNVTEDSEGNPQWSLDALLGGVNTAMAWIAEDNGGVAVDESFQDQYLYDPIIRLVQQGRVQFGYEASDVFFRRSDTARSNLEYRWLGEPGDVPVLETVVYAGIPRGSANRDGASSFLAWLLSNETQQRILANNRQKRIDSFGVLGGFSSLWKVTERMIPVSYPDLMYAVPPADWLRFPPPSPRHWAAARPVVVYPWLLREVAGQSQSRDLASAVSAWLLQQED